MNQSTSGVAHQESAGRMRRAYRIGRPAMKFERPISLGFSRTWPISAEAAIAKAIADGLPAPIARPDAVGRRRGLTSLLSPVNVSSERITDHQGFSVISKWQSP